MLFLEYYSISLFQIPYYKTYPACWQIDKGKLSSIVPGICYPLTNFRLSYISNFNSLLLMCSYLSRKSR